LFVKYLTTTEPPPVVEPDEAVPDILGLPEPPDTAVRVYEFAFTYVAKYSPAATVTPSTAEPTDDITTRDEGLVLATPWFA